MAKVNLITREFSVRLVFPDWEAACGFMYEFGEAFAKQFREEDPEILKPVDSYYHDTDGWHVKVSVCIDAKDALLDFIKTYCDEEELDFCDEDAIRAEHLAKVNRADKSGRRPPAEDPTGSDEDTEPKKKDEPN